MLTAILPAQVPSQLDALATETLVGQRWSARELMPFAGYVEWRKFSEAISRAITSVKSSGLDPADHFVGTAKMVTVGSRASRAIEDFELTRYGCYILFQNADSRKPEIAALQQYFAVQTRRQEVAPQPAPTGADLLALAVIEAQSMLAAKDERIAELEPLAAEASTYRQSAGLRTIQDLANDLRTHALATMPGVRILQEDVFDHAGRLGLIIRGNTVRHNQPTAQAINAGWVKPARKEITHSDESTSTKVYSRITPKGGARLWDGCLRYIAEHGTLTIPKADPTNQ